MSKKVGIYGGSFNPIHNGHINCLNTVQKKLGLDEIRVVPSYQSPGKDYLEKPSPQQRLEMVGIALADESEKFILESEEIDRKGESFTVDTVKALRKREDADYSLIVGLDVFYGFDQWKDFESLLEMASLIVVSRPGIPFPEGEEKFPEGLRPLIESFDFNLVTLKTGKYIQFLQLDDIDISSSDIRKMVRIGKNPDRFLHLGVENYIKDNEIYASDLGKIGDFEEFTKNCAQFLFDKKSANIKVFDFRNSGKESEFSLVCSGISTKHVQSLGNGLIKYVKEEYGVSPLSFEGQLEGRWVLIDYGALIVHIFYDFVRDEYRLEDLWKEAPTIDLGLK